MKKLSTLGKIAELILVLLVFLCLFGCLDSSQNQPKNEKIMVVASFYPLYDFAKNVGGDRINVSIMIPAGVEPHEYEPSPSDIIQLTNANLFIYNGAGLESWAPKLLEGINNSDLIVVNTSKNISLIDSQDNDVPGSDPHVWLSPVLAKIQVESIKNALIEADPAGKSFYEQNTLTYLNKLDILDTNFRQVFATCKKKDILITHATLAYFCKEYGCNQVPVEGVNAEGEPSPAALAAIIDQAKAKNITTVFVESLINPKSAQTIANDIKGTVAVFNSVHGVTQEEEQNGKNYLSLMQENIKIIKNNLNCN